MPISIPARGHTLHLAGVCVNRIGTVGSSARGENAVKTGAQCCAEKRARENAASRETLDVFPSSRVRFGHKLQPYPAAATRSFTMNDTASPDNRAEATRPWGSLRSSAVRAIICTILRPKRPVVDLLAPPSPPRDRSPFCLIGGALAGEILCVE